MTFRVSRAWVERMQRRLARIQRKEKASEELRSMSIRGSIYRLLTITPLVLACAIAAESRFHEDMFQSVSCTVKQEREISAYIEPVRQSDQLRSPSATPEMIRDAARVWIHGAADGTLKPLQPVSVDDSMEVGIKGDISTANKLVQTRLLGLMQREAKEGEYDGVIGDALLALRVSEVIKNSDSVSLANEANNQRIVLRKLKGFVPEFNRAQGQRLHAELAAFLKHQQPMDDIIKDAKGNLERDYQRDTQNELAVGDAESAAEVALLDSQPVPVLAKSIERKVRLSTHRYAHGVLTQLRLAYITEDRLKTDVNALLAKLSV